MDICPKCGLPKEACVCQEIAKEEQKIKMSTAKRKFGKISTVITGFSKNVDIEDVAKKLKSELACGGTAKENHIELQGEHRKKAKQVLVRLGFPEDSIIE